MHYFLFVVIVQLCTYEVSLIYVIYPGVNFHHLLFSLVCRSVNLQ